MSREITLLETTEGNYTCKVLQRQHWFSTETGDCYVEVQNNLTGNSLRERLTRRNVPAASYPASDHRLSAIEEFGFTPKGLVILYEEQTADMISRKLSFIAREHFPE